MTIELRHLHLLSLIEVVEATELKTNNMARVNGSGFKMKSSSPVKGLSNFFSSLGSQLKEGQKERGIFSEAGKAEKKSRKPGESKFKADVRRGKERRAKEKAAKVQEPYDIKSSSVFEPTKFGHEGKSFFGPTTSDLDRRLMMGDEKKLNLKSDVFDLSAKATEAPTAQEMINKAYKGTNNDWGKASKNAMDMYGTTLNELIGKRDSPVEKKSPTKKSGFKMKNSPAKNYKKGYYGVK